MQDFYTYAISAGLKRVADKESKIDKKLKLQLKARLAKTLPGNLVPRSGDFLGTISLTVYGGGGIRLNEYGKVTGVYDWLGK